MAAESPYKTAKYLPWPHDVRGMPRANTITPEVIPEIVANFDKLRVRDLPKAWAGRNDLIGAAITKYHKTFIANGPGHWPITHLVAGVASFGLALKIIEYRNKKSVADALIQKRDAGKTPEELAAQKAAHAHH